MIGGRTEHFPVEQWIDFVNGQLAPKQKQAMQEHLEAGCAECAKTSALWLRVNQVARREPQYEAPDWALRYVQNAFEVANNAPQKAKRALRIPRLVFDSFAQLAPVGVRSGAASAPRHLLYKSDEIAIEMQFEPDAKTEHVSIAGQVSNIALGGEGLAEMPIRLTRANRNVAETSTNKHGEFRISFEPEEGLQFSLEMLNGDHIAIPLSNATKAKS
jgi:hypothetical protein